MKTLLFTLTTIIALQCSQAQETEINAQEGITITVTVPTKTDKGTIIGGLYTQDTFLKATPLIGAQSASEDGKAVLVFENVPQGTFGITLFHDTNDNQKMDFEPSGMPKEMYGVSNNVMNFGPPQWEDAKFEVTTENIAMEIRM